MTQGLVLKCVGGLYRVLTDEGNTVACYARGLFRKDGFSPMAGDRVLLSDEDGTTVLHDVLPRRNIMLRPSVANIDRILLTVSVREPDFNAGLLDKMLAIARIKDIDCAIVITKSDLSDARRYYELYSSIGYPCLALCGKNADEAKHISQLMVRGVNLLCGNSGVGKTTLLNSFAGMRQQTAQISQKLGRGRHTTREAELYRVSQGVFLCDTPGFSSVSIENMAPETTPDTLARGFAEFEKYSGGCRFADCRHINEPDCEVRAALQRGEIAPSRYASYLQLMQEVGSIKRY